MSSACTKTADKFWSYYLELMLKKWTAIFYFFWKGTTILRGPTFQHIKDIDFFARKSAGLYDLGQQLSGTTNKGDT
jgi:hypothetical protein